MNKITLIRICLITFLFNMLNTTAFSQITWGKWYGGTLKESAHRVIITTDGYYMTVGYTYTYGSGGSDIYVIKNDKYGNTIWKRTYGGSKDEFGNSICETYGGNFMIAGSTMSYGAGGEDAYLIKINKDGDVLWTKTYGGTGNDIAKEVVLTNEGGYIFAGYSNSSGGNGFFDAYVVKTDNQGNVEWSKKLGGASFDIANSVKQTPSGEFVVLGETFSFGNGQSDFYFIKLKGNGDVVWSYTYGGAFLDEGKYIQIAPNGSYLLLGDTESYGNGMSNIYFINVSESGVLQWNRAYGGADKDVGKSVEPTSDGGYIVCGITRSKGVGGPDYWLIKTNSTGIPEWDKTYGTSKHEHAYYAKQTSDGGYIVTGHTNVTDADKEDIYTFKVDANGNINWNAKDAEVYKLHSPDEEDCESENMSFTVEIKNQGNASINNVLITLELTGAQNYTITKTISDYINPGNSKVIDIPTSINTTGGGVYDLKIYTSYPNDVYKGNDTLYKQIVIHKYADKPTVTSDFHCGPGEVTLNANSNDTIYWFSSLTSSNIKGTGNQFITPTLNETTTYYAQAGDLCKSERAAVDAVIMVSSTPEPIAGERCGAGTISLSASNSSIINWYDSVSGGSIIKTGNVFETPFLTSSTTFFVEGGDSCPSPRIPVEAIINELPEIDLGPDTIINNGNILLDAGNGFVSYLWNDNSTQQQKIVSASGTYWVTVSDSNNCMSTDSIIIQLISGIENDNYFNDLVLFPNPSKGVFEVSFNTYNSGSIEIILMNTLGQIVFQERVENQNSRISKNIDISEFASGKYFMRISSNNNIVIRKVIIN